MTFMFPRMLLPYWLREKLLNRSFQKKMGYRMDFNDPRTFNEKIQWCKLYYYHPDSRKIADKAAFKTYIAERLGEGCTAKLYGTWDNVAEIDLSRIPVPFVLKSNCCGYGDCVRFIWDRQEIDEGQLKRELKEWLDPMNTIIPQSARGYYGIRKPLIMAEEYLGSDREPPIDYKFFCFQGIPRYVYTASEHFRDGRAAVSAISFYDMDWNPLDIRYGSSRRKDVPKPVNFDGMYETAALLSKGFPFMRVDFYDCGSRWYVGEMTFSSGAGFKKFYPESFDRTLGDLFILPPKNTDREPFRGDMLAAYFRHAAGIIYKRMITGKRNVQQKEDKGNK